MIVCPGCGGRNPDTADVCAFCERRLTGGRGAAQPRSGEGLTAVATEASPRRRIAVRSLLIGVLVLALLAALAVYLLDKS